MAVESARRRVRVLVLGKRPDAQLRAWLDAVQRRFFDEERWNLVPHVAENLEGALELLKQREPFDLLYIGGDIGSREAERLLEECASLDDRPGVLLSYWHASLAPEFRERGIDTEIGTTRIVHAVKRRTARLADAQAVS